MASVLDYGYALELTVQWLMSDCEDRLVYSRTGSMLWKLAEKHKASPKACFKYNHVVRTLHKMQLRAI